MLLRGIKGHFVISVNWFWYFTFERNSEMENADGGLDVMEFKHVNMSVHFSPIENPWTS